MWLRFFFLYRIINDSALSHIYIYVYTYLNLLLLLYLQNFCDNAYIFTMIVWFVCTYVYLAQVNMYDINLVLVVRFSVLVEINKAERFIINS